MPCCYTNVPLPAPILTDNLTYSTERRLCAVRYVTNMVRNPIIRDFIAKLHGDGGGSRLTRSRKPSAITLTSRGLSYHQDGIGIRVLCFRCPLLRAEGATFIFGYFHPWLVRA